jgi:hypothetical protein
MTDLTNPSDFMALFDIKFDEVTPTRVTGSVAARHCPAPEHRRPVVRPAMSHRHASPGPGPRA